MGPRSNPPSVFHRGELLGYAVRRLAWCLPSLVLLTVLTFALLELAPGGGLDDLGTVLDPDPGVSDHALRMERTARLREQLGVDGDSPLERYVAWVRRIATVEFSGAAPSSSALWARLGSALPVTLLLNLLAGGIAIVLGTWVGVRRGWPGLGRSTSVGRRSRFGGECVLLGLAALPDMVLVGLCLAVFSGPLLGWLPISGLTSAQLQPSGGWAHLLDLCAHLVLPVGTLAMGPTAVVARHVRAAVRRLADGEFVDALFASGVAESVIRGRVLRNSLGVSVTLVGELGAGLLVGSVVIESGFGLPGLGALAIDAIRDRDMAMVLTLTTLSGMVATLALALADIVRALGDPRVRWDNP